MDTVAERLHYALIRHIIETGHAPGLTHLAEEADLSPDQAEQGLRHLETMHGVVLIPNSLDVWSLHPFALNPTAFWVKAAHGGWWANCAWCALAIGAALGEPVTISTSNGAEGEPLEFTVDGDQCSRGDLLMHFPYPPGCWWDNPHSPCVNILFFTSEAAIESWCARHGHAQGSVLTIDKGIQLASKWFGDYASSSWKRKTPQQAADIFRDLELDPTFWSIAGTFR